MKIAIISEYNIFTTLGGTEYYVDMLLKGLNKKGHNLIFITKGDLPEGVQMFENKYGYNVFLLPKTNFHKEEVQQKKVSASWQIMSPILENFRPDIIHAHTSTTFFNIKHIELCKSTCSNIFFTSHIPGNFCPKGDLIQNNVKPCNGHLGIKCSICLFSLDMKSGISNIFFRHTQKLQKNLATFNNLKVQMIFTSNWQKEQAIKNGFNADSVNVIRQALNTSNTSINNYLAPKLPTLKFSIGYLGRLSPEKGSALFFKLLDKYKNNSEYRFVIAIPPNSNPDDLKTLSEIYCHSNADIEILYTIDDTNKHLFFDKIDYLIIPSFCIETGPIVLLEAIFYNKFVIAPNIGGPLEFSLEFPDNIFVYNWNSLDSAMSCIELIKSKLVEKVQVKEIDFSERENKFIDKHIEIYSKSLLS
jgi:glycosyltransferase involved in cell wall biosynthesis